MHKQFPIPLELFKEFRDEYQKASDAGAELFKFHGQDVYTAYAKYVIEYELPYAIKAGHVKS